MLCTEYVILNHLSYLFHPKHLGHNWGLDSYFLTSNTYYPILTIFLDIRKAFNMEVIGSASQITSSRPTI